MWLLLWFTIDGMLSTLPLALSSAAYLVGVGVRGSTLLWSVRKAKADLSARAEEDPVEAEVELEFVDATLLIDVELKDAVIEAILEKKEISISRERQSAGDKEAKEIFNYFFTAQFIKSQLFSFSY